MLGGGFPIYITYYVFQIQTNFGILEVVLFLNFLVMKKVIVSALVLVGIFLGSFVVQAGEAPYSDMPYTNFEAVLQMYNDGIFAGYSDGTFGPYNYINRAELAKVLVLATGVTDDEIADAVDQYVDTYGSSEASFTDVDATLSADEVWYVDYVIYAKSQGWISGYPDGSYGAGNNVNVVEALKMIVETQYGTPDDSYAGSNWYDVYLNFLVGYDVLDDGGIEDGDIYYGYNSYLPVGTFSDDIYRINVAELLYRMGECAIDGEMMMYDPYLTVEEYEDTYGGVFVLEDSYLSLYDSYFNFELENLYVGDYALDELEFSAQDPSGFENGFEVFWEIKYPYDDGEYWDPMWLNVIDNDYAEDWYPVDFSNDHGQSYALYCYTYGVTDELQDIADGVCPGDYLSDDINFASSNVTKEVADEFFSMIADGDYEDAYNSTSDAFQEASDYDEYMSVVEDALLYEYTDLIVNDIEYYESTLGISQTLYADWYDFYDYYYPIEIYFSKYDGEWELDGFYFTE